MSAPDDPGNRTTELETVAAGLRQDVGRLGERIDGLREDLGNLGDRQRKSDARILWVVIGLVVVVALAVAIGFVAARAQETANEQAALRNDVLCPLYSIFLGSYDPKTRDKNPDPAARQKYEDAFVKIRYGWDVMGCTDPLVPPRSN